MTKAFKVLKHQWKLENVQVLLFFFLYIELFSVWVQKILISIKAISNRDLLSE